MKESAKNNSWNEAQDELAQKSGLAVILVDENSPALLKSNNNSMCEILYNSEEFAPECDKYCGKAFDWATEKGGMVEYKCYAGLNCKAIRLETESKPLVVITGRAFLKAEDYRQATKRAISGDWQQFPPDEFFGNALLSGSEKDLETLANKVVKLSERKKDALERTFDKTETSRKTDEKQTEKSEVIDKDELSKLIEQFHKSQGQTGISSEKINRRNDEEAKEIAEWRSLFGRLLNLSYEKAYKSILRFLSERYAVSSLAWLEKKGNRLETIFAVGDFDSRQIQIAIEADDERLLTAAQRETALEFEEKQTRRTKTDQPETITLFPAAVGESVQSALVVGDKINDSVKKSIARFCHQVASQLEILRLREELSRRAWLERAFQKFNENLKNIDSEDFWLSLVQISAELMRAERSSLLLFDEKSGSFKVKAAIGARADVIKRETGTLGARVASKVLRQARAVIVADVNKIRLGAAPADWGYKTNSFISYPITVGERKIGILNVTDRADREIYNENDLELLNAVAPQLGVSIDSVTFRNKANDLEQLSVTDHLTGLLNKRYMDERLTEETKRSNRHGFPMSFMMIDVDFFKPYNDNFGHAAGDKALKIIGNCMKESLRGADVAARFGGEEFSILLPQTTSDEALIIGERVRERVETTEFPHRKITVSIGIASCSHIVCSPDIIVEAADKALYAAKKKGRNNVQIYENLKGKDKD